jgi:hypothetical protein
MAEAHAATASGRFQRIAAETSAVARALASAEVTEAMSGELSALAEQCREDARVAAESAAAAEAQDFKVRRALSAVGPQLREAGNLLRHLEKAKAWAETAISQGCLVGGKQEAAEGAANLMARGLRMARHCDAEAAARCARGCITILQARAMPQG